MNECGKGLLGYWGSSLFSVLVLEQSSGWKQALASTSTVLGSKIEVLSLQEKAGARRNDPRSLSLSADPDNPHPLN